MNNLTARVAAAARGGAWVRRKTGWWKEGDKGRKTGKKGRVRRRKSGGMEG